ncbi:DUF1572 domain-containing protein [Tamlana sp. 62-3]|uniref:DUF1572 domain-containing protein n=1 Tax=Neotamlana sargassicola TaxID=2883125 RepID=A0A9X1I7I4_9FLAO|nr:DUF1572 family protein [Tamlana sargassicola]MCB4808300.1 DUF1572 domain-containing protein [Tamlana sargassicola]
MESYLTSIIKQFEYYKSLGDKTLEQLTFEDTQWQSHENANSIAVIVKHLSGNMLSRWTNFLTEDGEKAWRNRDEEFIDSFTSFKALVAAWESGWSCLFKAISSLNETNLNEIIYIRNGGHTVIEAINRQLAHYSYHIGQIVFLGKLLKGYEWKSLSIPKGDSKTYNASKFSQEKENRHFTDDL